MAANRFITVIAPGSAGRIDDPRTILIVLEDTDMAAYRTVPMTIEAQTKWWLDLLVSRRAWAYTLLSVYQQKDGKKWTNSFQVTYK